MLLWSVRHGSRKCDRRVSAGHCLWTVLCFPEDHASRRVKDELRQGERRGGTLSWETKEWFKKEIVWMKLQQ